MRASDRDRDVVLQVLGEGYADGRLDKDEYDARAASTSTAKTLGELAPIIADLVPEVPVGRDQELLHLSPEQLRANAVRQYESSRRHAISGMVIPSVITIVIWFATSFGGGWHWQFPWPLFVVLGTGINLLRVLLHKQDIIEEERLRLERKRAKALGMPRPDRRND
jgi:hypothetical protein